jgi:FixJ family two-component response regulator
MGLAISRSIVEAAAAPTDFGCGFAWLNFSRRPSDSRRGGRPMNGQVEPQSVVFVVDHDPPMRNAMQLLFRSVGLRSEAYASVAEFLQRKPADTPCCLVLDVRLPGLSGLDFQAELTKANNQVPIVFMTGYGDITMTAKAMKAGAIEFLPKPIRNQDMLDAVHLGLERDRIRREREKTFADVKARFASLTPRAQEVMGFVTAGLLNKQIAAEMQLAETTIKVHRATIMRKMGAKSLADLVRMAEIVEIRKKA